MSNSNLVCFGRLVTQRICLIWPGSHLTLAAA